MSLYVQYKTLKLYEYGRIVYSTESTIRSTEEERGMEYFMNVDHPFMLLLLIHKNGSY